MNSKKRTIQEGQRFEWLDALKGFAILTVVLGHVLLGYIENDSFPEINSVLNLMQKWIYTWHMPLFFVLSGYAFQISCSNRDADDGKLNRKKVGKSAINLLIVYLIFVVLLGLLKITFSEFVDNPMSVNGFFFSVLFPSTLMWYLWVLVLYYLLFLLLDDLDLRWEVLFAVFLVIAVVTKTASNIWSIRICIRNFFYCLPFFYTGIQLVKYSFLNGVMRREKMKNVLNRKVTVVAIIYMFLFSVYYCKDVYTSLPLLVRVILETIAAFAMAFTLLSVFYGQKKVGSNTCLKKLGRASLVIYLLHTYIVTALKVLFIRIGFSNWFIAIILTWIVPTVIAYIIFLFSSKTIIGFVFKPVAFFDARKKLWDRTQ